MLAEAGLVSKLMKQPFRTIKGFFFSFIGSNLYKNGLIARTKTFYDETFYINLPAGLDIYLLGIKSHRAERRLTTFMLEHLKSGLFVDIGAHFGFYTQLASHLCRDNGRVIAFEPAKKTYEVLKLNANRFHNISIYNEAVANVSSIQFREYAVSHSEYNAAKAQSISTEYSTDGIAFDDYEIKASSLDQIIPHNKGQDVMIKIDVEGGEEAVIRGGHEVLNTLNITVIMEYHLHHEAGTIGCQKAWDILQNLGYIAYSIKDDGQLAIIDDQSPENYLRATNQLVDNLVFRKN